MFSHRLWLEWQTVTLTCTSRQQHVAHALATNCDAVQSRRRKLTGQRLRSKLALAAALAVPARRRRDEGHVWQAATGQDTKTAVALETLDEKISELRFGAMDPFMMNWIGAKLRSSFPEVHFSGVLLTSEAGSCGPDQLTFLQELLNGEEVDFVVLPAKDVALSLPSDLTAAAILREDARDALVVRPGISPVASLSDLPPGSTVCVSCARRSLHISTRFPSLKVEECTASSQSKLRRLYSQDYDAVIGAVAGLQRTGLKEALPLDVGEVMPALCQGAVTMLCRSKDEDMVSLLANCDDRSARVCVAAERDLLRQLGRLPQGTAVGGLAQLLGPDQHLLLRSAMVFSDADPQSPPRMFEVEMEGPGEDWQDMAQRMAKALLADLNASVDFPLDDRHEAQGRIKSTAVTDDAEEEEEAADYSAVNGQEALPSRGPARLAVSEIDGTGRTPYVGHVCGMLSKGRGLLVDINCEVPAFWYPEHVSSSSSTPPSLSQDQEELGPLASDVEVYCCAKHACYLRVVSEPPVRLKVRRGIPRLKLDELRPGQGPWRAVVISSGYDGTLVDFNCELPGLLKSDRRHIRGEEVRVYCFRVDKRTQTCVVSTAKEPAKVDERRKLSDLALDDNSVAVRGTVLNVTGNGVFVDVNCEVRGYLSPMDIDLNACNVLSKGFEVMVYIKSVNFDKRQVRLTMFRPGEPVRVLGEVKWG
ncbi:unnamed protein product [Durusdinium trenchii]|uniref:hydroxymethylbilane synthase n=1 Tax=Durusdinium trenchii TaxID=1381693 RepID=A0ABP0QJZ7_9DINO